MTGLERQEFIVLTKTCSCVFVGIEQPEFVGLQTKLYAPRELTDVYRATVVVTLLVSWYW